MMNSRITHEYLRKVVLLHSLTDKWPIGVELNQVSHSMQRERLRCKAKVEDKSRR